MTEPTPPGTDLAQVLELDRATGRPRRTRRWLILAGLALLAAAALVLWRGLEQAPAVAFRTQPATRGDLTVTITATGTLQPTNKVDVSSELSGILKTVAVDYNDRVTVGQVLAVLDATKLEAQVKQSRAAVEAAKAKVMQAKATVKETGAKLAQLQAVRKMSQNKVPSQADLDAAEAALERARADEASARAAASQAQATLEVNETDLAKASIRSPINGVVLTRSAEPGQTVASSLQAPVLFNLAEDLTQMELCVNVDEADVGQVATGQEATFSVAAYPSRAFQARIVQVRFGSKTVDGVVTYETVLRVDNSALLLRPGMTATAEITVKRVVDAVLVPAAALRFSPPAAAEKGPSRGLLGALLPGPPRPPAGQGGEADAKAKGQRVWTLEDGRPKAIPVTVGASDGVRTELLEGLVQPGLALLVDVAGGGR